MSPVVTIARNIITNPRGVGAQRYHTITILEVMEVPCEQWRYSVTLRDARGAVVAEMSCVTGWDDFKTGRPVKWAQDVAARWERIYRDRARAA